MKNKIFFTEKLVEISRENLPLCSLFKASPLFHLGGGDFPSRLNKSKPTDCKSWKVMHSKISASLVEKLFSETMKRES